MSQLCNDTSSSLASSPPGLFLEPETTSTSQGTLAQPCPRTCSLKQTGHKNKDQLLRWSPYDMLWNALQTIGRRPPQRRRTGGTRTGYIQRRGERGHRCRRWASLGWRAFLTATAKRRKGTTKKVWKLEMGGKHLKWTESPVEWFVWSSNERETGRGKKRWGWQSPVRETVPVMAGGGLQANRRFGRNTCCYAQKGRSSSWNDLLRIGGERRQEAWGSPPQSFRTLLFLTACLWLSWATSPNSFGCGAKLE